jgi:hypothetical protein
MRRFLGTKVSLVVLGMLAALLSIGVVWAAGAPGPWNRITLEPQIPEILVHPHTVMVNEQSRRPGMEIMGSGFIPGELVFIQIEREPEGNIVIPLGATQARANNNRAFFIQVHSLPADIGAGIYTIKASGTRGSPVVTQPFRVLEEKIR